MDAITEVTEYSDIFDGMNVVVVGIAGGTGSGKSTLARAIRQGLPESEIAYLSHDNYYKDISGLSFEMRASHNFDHPDALDTDLMYEHVMKLKDGIEISMPTYDFGTHKRMETSVRVHPCKVILVEGILIFTHEKLRDALDVKIFVDTADDIRLIRRLERDMQERKRSAVSVVNQYKKNGAANAQTLCRANESPRQRHCSGWPQRCRPGSHRITPPLRNQQVKKSLIP